VYVYAGTFTMYGGTISNNTSTADQGGGGVCEGGTGTTFVMHGGTISGNTATNNGGGVMVNTGGTVRFVAGTIYGNENAVDAALKNNAAAGAALYYPGGSGTAQRGTFAADGEWIPTTGGTLTTTNNTIQ
jgi:hypothetical protein